ncbi:MAG: roadblock/LC7 domain-containing protein [Elainellaceae cyanobacterium]
MAINTQKLNSVMQSFVASTPDIQAAALVTTDGLPLSTALPSRLDEERVSAMSAAILALGDRIGTELLRGTIERVYIEGKEGYAVLTNCSEDAVLLVLANRAAKQGILILEIKRILKDLRAILAG